MANLWNGEIKTFGEYKKLATISGVSFVDDKTYTIQVQGACTLCESATTPSTGGFLISNLTPIQYKKRSGYDLYVKDESYDCTLNIAE